MRSSRLAPAAVCRSANVRSLSTSVRVSVAAVDLRRLMLATALVFLFLVGGVPDALGSTTLYVARDGTIEASSADYVCDGSDDDVEINAAIDEIGASGGGTIHVGAGMYSLSRPIAVLQDGVTLEGISGQTTLQTAPDFALGAIDGVFIPGVVTFVGVGNFACRGMTVDADTNATSTNGIVVIRDGPDFTGNPSLNGVIEGNRVFTEQTHAYSIWNFGGNHVVIQDNFVDGGSTAANNSQNQEGIETVASNDVLITRNTIRNIGNSAINIGEVYDVQPDTTTDGVRVLNNLIEHSRTGVHVGAVLYQGDDVPRPVIGVTIAGNTMHQVSEFGVAMRAYNGRADAPLILKDVHVSGNTIEVVDIDANAPVTTRGARAAGVLVIDGSEPGTTVFGNISVEGNQVRVVGADGPMPVSGVAAAVWSGGPVWPARIVFSGVTDFTLAGNVVNAGAASALFIHDGGAFKLRPNDFNGAPAIVDRLNPLTLEGFGFTSAADVSLATEFGSQGTILYLGSNEQLLFLGKTMRDVQALSFTFGGAPAATPLLIHDSRAERHLSGDFDGDGREELVWRDFSGRMWAAELQSNNTYSRRALNAGPLSFEWRVAGTGDFDADGRSDILWQHENGALAVWYEGVASRGYMIDQNVTGWRVLGTGDFDGNGSTDVLLREGSTGELGVSWFDRGSYTGSYLVASPDASVYDVVGIADFDGDGKDDLLWMDSSGQLSITRIVQRTVSTMHYVGGRLGSWTLVGIGDTNGDGRSDPVFWHANGQVAVWLMRADLTFYPAYVGSPVSRAQYYLAGVGDATGDGRADLSWLNLDGAVATWALNGSYYRSFTSAAATYLHLLQ